MWLRPRASRLLAQSSSFSLQSYYRTDRCCSMRITGDIRWKKLYLFQLEKNVFVDAVNIWATESELIQHSIQYRTWLESRAVNHTSEPCISSLTVVGGVTYQCRLCQYTGEIAVFVAAVNSGTLSAARRRRSTGTLCCRCSASLLLLAVSFSFPLDHYRTILQLFASILFYDTLLVLFSHYRNTESSYASRL